jgi:hypothetical protein
MTTDFVSSKHDIHGLNMIFQTNSISMAQAILISPFSFQRVQQTLPGFLHISHVSLSLSMKSHKVFQRQVHLKQRGEDVNNAAYIQSKRVVTHSLSNEHSFHD